MRSFLAWAGPLAVVLAFAGCGGDTSGPPGELTGVYSLATIDDAPLPAEWDTGGGCQAEYRRMSITFVSDRTVQVRLEARVVCNDADYDVDIDTYAYGGDPRAYEYDSRTLRIYDDDDELMLSGPASSSTLTLAAADGAVFVFRK